MRKVIVTGATSMIGINLIQKLLSENIKVLAIIRENSKRKSNLPQNSNLEIIECDLENLATLELKEKDYDCLYHLAWKATILEERNDVYKQTENIKYTLDALALAKRSNCKKFIGAGSQAEYGRVNDIIKPDTKTNPESGYGISKLCAGQMSRLLANELGIEHVWTRIFSVYGPYDSDNTMIMKSIRELSLGTSPQYTLGEQYCDYLYIEDAIEALYLLGDKGKNNKIYCIGSGKTKKIREYIEILKDKIDSSVKLDIGAIPYRENQIMELCADISDLTQDTGFYPKISFEEGIVKTIEWYQKQ